MLLGELLGNPKGTKSFSSWSEFTDFVNEMPIKTIQPFVSDFNAFAGEGFSLELIRRYGIRVSELGDYSMEYDLKTPEQQAEVCNVVRFAIDRDRLSKEHLDYVIAAVSELYKDRASIPNMRIVWGHNLPMRHFHAFLEPYAPTEAEK